MNIMRFRIFLDSLLVVLQRTARFYYQGRRFDPVVYCLRGVRIVWYFSIFWIHWTRILDKTPYEKFPFDKYFIEISTPRPWTKLITMSTLKAAGVFRKDYDRREHKWLFSKQ